MKMELHKSKSSAVMQKGGLISIPPDSSAQLLLVYKNSESLEVLIGKNAVLELFSVYNSGAKVNAKFNLSEGSKVEAAEIFGSNARADLLFSLNERRASLKLSAKGAIREGKSRYYALASIGINGSGCEVDLVEHAYLLGKNARADLLPGLEIKNSDVGARHASSITELDGEQVFYLMSRGFSEKEAKDEIISSFLSREIKRIKEIFGEKAITSPFQKPL